MFWDRIGLKTDGKEKFRRNYGSCVLVSLIISLITGTGFTTYIDRWMEDHIFALWFLIPGAAVLLIQILVFSVLEMGACRFYVENRDYQAGISKILFGFQSGHYGNVVLVMFFRNLFIFLWTLLLIIPGIIKTYEYRMVPYILAEQPDISSKENDDGTEAGSFWAGSFFYWMVVWLCFYLRDPGNLLGNALSGSYKCGALRSFKGRLDQETFQSGKPVC